MNQIFFALFLAIVGGDALAQSSLPPCPTDASIVRTNCVGTAATTTGGSYSGGLKTTNFLARERSLLSMEQSTSVNLERTSLRKRIANIGGQLRTCRRCLARPIYSDYIQGSLVLGFS